MLIPFLALLAPAYRIVDLGLPPGATEARATAINNRGEVLVQVPYRITRTYKEPGGPTWTNGHGYLWREGRFLAFGEPDGTGMLDDPLTTKPTALNDRSVAVGSEGTGGPIFMSGRAWVYPFVWRGRGMVRAAPGQTNVPRAINVRGDVVGGDNIRGYALLDGKVWDLGSLSRVPAGNRSDAVAINAHRLILGTSTYGGTPGKIDYGLPSRPFTIDGNRLPLRKVPVPLPEGYRNATGCALNDAGTILCVAYREKGGPGLPYFVRGGRILPLPTPSAKETYGGARMNAREDVVANLDGSGSRRASHPALWIAGLPVSFPTFEDWTLQTATGINDQGAICGTGVHDGNTRAYVLLPV